MVHGADANGGARTEFVQTLEGEGCGRAPDVGKLAAQQPSEFDGHPSIAPSLELASPGLRLAPLHTHDVAIVGAGPAGSSLAILLARSGYDVLLIDRARFPRDKACGDFVSPRAFQLLSALGCASAIEALDALPVRTAEVVLDGELLALNDIPDVGDVPGIGRVIPRRDLDDIVFRAACASGAESLQGCRVVDFDRGKRAVHIRAEMEGARRTLQAKIIVGADGAQSAVATLAGLGQKDPRHMFSSMRGYLSGLPLEHATFFFSSESFPGYAWLFPMRDGLANYGAGILAEASTRDGLRVRDFVIGVKELVEERARGSGASVSFDRPIGWPIKTFPVEAPRTFECGLLIGEAGGFVNPINGEGIPLAIETAALAAEVIDDALRTGRVTLRTMQPFDARWRAHSEVDLRVAEFLTGLIRNRDLRALWLAWFRALNRRAARDRAYAARVTGVLAGALPNRVLFGADVVAKSMMQDVELWRDLVGQLGREWARPLEFLPKLWRSAPAESKGAPRYADWWLGWLNDVLRSQVGAVEAFIRSTVQE
jgi:geranylgeranyl reductase family protein